MNRGPSSFSPPATLLQRRLPFYYGYVIVAIGFLTSFMMGAASFWAMPIFVGAMNDDTGWSHTSILAGLSVHFLMGGVGVIETDGAQNADAPDQSQGCAGPDRHLDRQAAW